MTRRSFLRAVPLLALFTEAKSVRAEGPRCGICGGLYFEHDTGVMVVSGFDHKPWCDHIFLTIEHRNVIQLSPGPSWIGV